MKIRARLPAIILVILIAIFTIAWIKYPGKEFIKVEIPKYKLNIPVISKLSGKIVAIDKNKIIFNTINGDIDIYNYKNLNKFVSLTPNKYITFITQTDISYSGKKEYLIIGIISQGTKILFDKPLIYCKHYTIIDHLIAIINKARKILSKLQLV